MGSRSLPTVRSAFWRAALCAALLFALLALPWDGPGAAGHPAVAGEAAQDAHAAVDALRSALAALPPSEHPGRSEAEGTLAGRLAAWGPAAVAQVLREAPAQPGGAADAAVLLRLLALSGDPAFLPVLHAVLAQPHPAPADGALRDVQLAALAAVVSWQHPASAAHVAPFLAAPEPGLVLAALRYFRAVPQELTPGGLSSVEGRKEPHLQAALLGLLPLRPAALGRGHAALGRGHAAAQACRAGVSAPHGLVRLEAVRCLRVLGSPADVPPLLERFERETPAVRAAIVTTVEALQGDAALPHLLRWLAHPQRPPALAALVALQRKQAPQAVEQTVDALMALIERGGSPIPEAVLVKSLGLHRDPRALPLLEGRLNGASDAAQRLPLIEALGDLGRLEGQDALLPYLSDPDPAVREAARHAMKAIATAELQRPRG